MKQRSYISRVALALIAFFAIGLTANQVLSQSDCIFGGTRVINCSFEDGNFRGYHPLDKLRLPDRPPVDSGNPLNKLKLVDGGSGPPPPPPSAEIRMSHQEDMSPQRLARKDGQADDCSIENPSPLVPTDGQFFALLHTVRRTDSGPYFLRQSVVVQESFVPRGVTELSVDLNFLTNVLVPGPENDDTASVYLTKEETGETVKIWFYSRNCLFDPADPRCEPIGQPLMGEGCFRISTGWREIRFLLPPDFIGQKVFLTFNVRKASLPNEKTCPFPYTQCNTALAIDNIRLQ